jgi:SAM-dependent methyltransferase
MDELARLNRLRWNALSQAGIEYGRPALALDEPGARALIDPEGVLGEVRGLRVLCLAAGGGQQSVAFAMLGAAVTVLDISDVQLAKDQEAARHYALTITTLRGDMRNLSEVPHRPFDLVWHGHSINFVPDVACVFREVTSVLRPGGLYRLHFVNPFVHGLWLEPWSGGYPLRRPYLDGAVVDGLDELWRFQDGHGAEHAMPGPPEFRHTLGTIINTLIRTGFEIRGLWEENTGDLNAVPGSWQHFKAIAPPWLAIWAARGLQDVSPGCTAEHKRA